MRELRAIRLMTPAIFLRVLAQHHRQFDVSLATAGIGWRFSPRSHAPRGNAVRDAPRPWAGPKVATPSVEDGIPTRSVGTRVGRLLRVVVISEHSRKSLSF